MIRGLKKRDGEKLEDGGTVAQGGGRVDVGAGRDERAAQLDLLALGLARCPLDTLRTPRRLTARTD